MKKFFTLIVLSLTLFGIFHFFINKNYERENGVKSVNLNHEVVTREKTVFSPFNTKTVTPDFFLNGAGKELEAPEFFETERPEDTLLFVSGKKSEGIEIWKFPFLGIQEKIFQRDSSPSGLAIDQESDVLFVTDVDKKIIESFSLPDFTPVSSFGGGEIKSGENNLDTLTLPDGSRRLYVTDNNEVFRFKLLGGPSELIFSPNVESIEEVLADSFHQVIYVPDEQGGNSKVHPGGAILAFHPDGSPFLKNGNNIFGQGKYTGDAEGMDMYSCLDKQGTDTGQGFIISTDQDTGEGNGFEFYDRVTWEHLGTLALEGVQETDGIDASERPLPGYAQGLFAAINYDQSVSITSWAKISQATGLICPN